MFATEWLRASPALLRCWSGMLALGLVGLVLWFVWWRGPDRVGLSETPLPPAAMSETPSKGASTGPPQPDASPLRADITPASRDPFVIYVAPPPVPQPVVAAAPVVAAPIVHREPPPSLVFAGRMRTPDGRTLVLARWADGTPVSLEEGKELGNGYRVERMTEQSVDLLNPQTQAMVQLLLPVAPRFETR